MGKKGKNTLAAVVWNFAEMKPVAQVSFNQTGLIVQGNTAAEEAVNTNDSWLCSHNGSYKPHQARVYGYYAAGPGEQVDAAVVPGGDTPVGLTVLAADSPPMSLVQALSASPQVELLKPTTENPMLAYFIAIAFGIVFMMSAITFGTTIAQSVVEEKQTRIVEILLATVSARTILAGKILGNSILALGQVIAIAALTSVGMLATGQDLLLGELGTALIWFAILFAFGFVLLASLYAALASLVSRQEDVASAVSPVMWLVMIPYIAIIMFNTNVKVLAIMSYIPFSAPVGMPMRLYLGTAEWWEPVVSLGILVVAIAIVWWLGARIYERSILRTGAKVKLKDALAAKE